MERTDAVVTEIVLALGALVVPGFFVKRSGIHWLVPDGAVCRARQVVGFCNISLAAREGGGTAGAPFADKTDVQVALALPVGGRLRMDRAASFGGYLNVLGATLWEGGLAVALLEVADAGGAEPTVAMLHLMLAGEPMTGLANDGRSLLRGWHSRVRAWWDAPGGAAGPRRALVALGICDAQGPVLGDAGAFLEFFEAADFAGHVVLVPYKILAPCVTFLLEQFLRTEAMIEAIAEDIRAAVFNGPVPADAADYFFAGTLLTMLRGSPLREAGRIGEAPAILLSAAAEPVRIRRHKRLGYHLHCFRFHLEAAGPAVTAWFAAAFAWETRTVDDVERDYAAFFGAVRAAMPARFIVMNRMSTSGREDISCYAPFDAPMGQSLVYVAAKEMNVMLDGLAAGDVAVADVDAIAAELGGGRHLPDGMHQSGAMQRRMRAEIVRLMG